MSGIKKTAQKKNKVIIIAFIIASLAIIFFAYYYKEKKNKPTSQPYKRYEVPFKKDILTKLKPTQKETRLRRKFYLNQ